MLNLIINIQMVVHDIFEVYFRDRSFVLILRQNALTVKTMNESKNSLTWTFAFT